MKKILTLILFLISSTALCQSDYFMGKETFCPMPDKKAEKLYALGIECILRNSRIGSANQIFMDLVKKDSTFCDAYFFAGYTFRLSNMSKEAFAMYYMADSLSYNKSLIFKQNLAAVAMEGGLIDFSRNKFEEIIEYFPESPEGYYGIATSSVFVGDFQNGLTNLNLAMLKYKDNSIIIGNEVYLTKAILLSSSGEFEKSLPYYERISGKLTKDDTYKIHYAYSLRKVGNSKNDKSLIKKSSRIYKKINDKSILTEEMKLEFGE